MTVLKGFGQLGTAAWASGGVVNTARGEQGSAGYNTSAMIFGGKDTPTVTDITELYNGSTWTEVADLNTARAYTNGAGTSTAALCIGGFIPGAPAGRDETEIWDGTSWTEVGDLNTARASGGTCGTTTAALYAAGAVGPSPPMFTEVEEWDGTSWTEIADVGTARYYVQSAQKGTTTAALIAGGKPPSVDLLVESFDGTTWTETTDIPANKAQGGGAGTQGFALIYGGVLPPYDSTLQWNGSAWTAVATMGAAAYSIGSGGTGTTAWWATGRGSPGALSTASEYFTTPDAIKTFTSS